MEYAGKAEQSRKRALELIDTVSERKDSAGQGRPPDRIVASAIQMADIQLVAYVKGNGFHGIMHRNPGVGHTELLVAFFSSLVGTGKGKILRQHCANDV